MVKIDCIMYSKDRPMQLNLLMRSMKDKFKNIGEVFLIYKASSDLFQKGYNKALYNNYYFNINLFPENNFKEQVIDIIKNRMVSNTFVGLCDDDVFIKDTDCSEIIEKSDEENVSAISLKGGLNITYNYPDIKVDYPNFIETEQYLKWKWRDSRPDIDWGYPTCVNSYIFKRDYFLNLINGMDFKHPPTLEAGLNTRRRLFKEFMYSFREQKLLNIPINRIQTLSPNAFATKYSYTIEELNEKFLNGYIISTDNIYNFQPRMGNEEIKFQFEKK